jgi:chromate transporter
VPELPVSAEQTGSPGEVFGAFLKLGLTSFGGPIAHLGYFRDEFVSRRGWFDDKSYGDLVALCQFLPGPASSQVGFAIGLMRAGPLGAAAAWAGFTLPSAILMVLIALGAAALNGDVAQGVLHGLKLVAVAVVAQAVLGMAKSLTPDRTRAGIAVLAVLAMVVLGGVVGQVGAIVLGIALGLVLCREAGAEVAAGPKAPVSRGFGIFALLLFVGLLVVLPLVAGANPGVALFDAFYRAGALVFGGGHVVLPLLEAGTVGQGWLSADTFLAGYGAAQAMPGPLFTFAAYLGAGAADCACGAAVLARAARQSAGAGRDARRQCGRSGRAGAGALQSGLHLGGFVAAGLCAGAGRVRGAGELEIAAAGSGTGTGHLRWGARRPLDPISRPDCRGA